MKVGIVTYYFDPVINPRAFRALELAREFAVRNIDTTVFVPDLKHDYTSLCARYNFKVYPIAPGFWLNSQTRIIPDTSTGKLETEPTLSSPPKVNLLSKIKRLVVRNFFPGGFNFEYAFTASKVLKRIDDFDLVISIGLPISSHLAVSRAYRSVRNKPVLFADYGDPYSFSKIINPPKWHRFMERKMLRPFDYILTPTEKAISSFLYFKKPDQIKVIPQGVNQKNVRLQVPIKRTNGPRFIFAGNFYLGIRDPYEILQFLVELNEDFEFVIYTNTKDHTNMSLVQPYEKLLGNKLLIRHLLEREACIYEMSGADFLVNISNTVDEHSPSKLIDYCLTKRPVFSYVPGKFIKSIFEKFLNGNYEDDLGKKIDISAFDIEKIVNDIIELSQNVK